jgi:hypothetical protein
MAKGRGVAGRRGVKKWASSVVIDGFHIKIEALIVITCPDHSGTGHCWHRDYIS